MTRKVKISKFQTIGISFLLLFLSFTALKGQKLNNTKHYPFLIEINEKIDLGLTGPFITEYFSLNTDESFELEKTSSDELGYTHQFYRYKVQGIEVEGTRIAAHYKNGTLETISNNFWSVSKADVNPNLSKNEAFEKALEHVNATNYLWESDTSFDILGDLVILSPKITGSANLCYKFDIYSYDPLYHAYVYIDAKTGSVVLENEKIHHTNVPATGSSLYNGNVSFTADQTSQSNYRLRQTSSGNGVETYDLNNGTNYSLAADFTSTSSNFISDDVAVQAHWGAEKTHDYFLNEHNRNSYDGNGSVLKSYVHYSSNYVNAYWDGSRMTYGDGDGTNYGPLVSLDIVGHELAHGVTEFSAGLIYQREYGALNESFSDIFGEAIENYATGSNDWLMGDQIGIGGSGAIRSMSNPNAFGDPDTYGGTYWYNPSCGTPAQSNDYCGVHINSGVQNKWFYILSQGEAGVNDNSDSYNVSGIGIDKAAQIAYRNLSTYLNSTSSFNDSRTGSIQSAIDLFGAGSMEVIATTNAWYAVGVGCEYGTLCYCASKGQNANFEWISSVNVGSFTNSSSSSLYTDFTSQTIPVIENSNISISLTPDFSGTTYVEYWKVWIDFDKNGIFESNELVFSPSPSSSAVSGTISIPIDRAGSTRMRVSMKWNAPQTSCEVFSYGEVEDYTIYIKEPITYDGSWDGGSGNGNEANSTDGTRNARVISGTANQTISGAVRNLFVDPGATLVIKSPAVLTVNGLLDNQGTIIVENGAQLIN